MTEQNKTGDKFSGKQKQLTVAEHKALKEKEAKKFKFKLPPIVQFILWLPLILIVLFGLFYIPFLFIRGMDPSAPHADKTDSTDTK